MGKIGLQLYSVRDAAGKDFLGTVRRIADMGYDGIQFAGFFNTPAEELKKVLDEKGITAAGSHMGLDTLRGENLKQTLEYNQKIGNGLIICPYLPEEIRKTSDDYKKIAEVLNEVGRTCRENGFTFAYHNHNFEFEAFDGETGFNILFENTDPQFVKVELDCYWVTYAGLSPTDIIEKYGDRVVSLHIKDMKMVDGVKRSIEIGSGELDINGLLNTGDQFGVNWYIVEQEQFDGDPMESSLINIENLKSKAGR
ncbi:sugar phosphate isomerase/epimerase family protein [Neobacillus cucumis]|uniref:Sugar phosphate isomerase/epimerase n=1 Tax=Neobacillus cucumis TaxID=1740721 RepID=A0A2N5H6E3_9BACI|nr:sugar phosphate isomerase/epimerase [Neobacillus cucumis]PLS01076.1 sugar phosphate isomerase/epimerase [Neobacillus cucumis]